MKKIISILIIIISLGTFSFAKDSFWDKVLNGTREIKEAEREEIIKTVNDFYEDYCTYDYQKIIRHFQNDGEEILILHNGNWIINRESFEENIANKKYDFKNKKWNYVFREMKFHKHFLDENMPANAYDVIIDFSMENEKDWGNELILIRENDKLKVYWLIVLESR